MCAWLIFRPTTGPFPQSSQRLAMTLPEAHAREALTLLRAVPYDVVAVDVELSKIDGEDLFVRIHERFPDLPMILLKGFGYDAGHRLVRARQMGLRVFLYKPFRIERLVESLEDAVFRRDAQEPITSSSSPKAGRVALT